MPLHKSLTCVTVGGWCGSIIKNIWHHHLEKFLNRRKFKLAVCVAGKNVMDLIKKIFIVTLFFVPNFVFASVQNNTQTCDEFFSCTGTQDFPDNFPDNKFYIFPNEGTILKFVLHNVVDVVIVLDESDNICTISPASGGLLVTVSNFTDCDPGFTTTPQIFRIQDSGYTSEFILKSVSESSSIVLISGFTSTTSSSTQMVTIDDLWRSWLISQQWVIFLLSFPVLGFIYSLYRKRKE